MLGTSFESVSSLPENGDRSVRANVTRDRQKEHEREQETTRNQLYYGNWPQEMRTDAFYGLAGELVRTIEPQSEADPAALLIQFLVGFGNVIGRRPHFVAEADLHFTNLFAVIVGQTSKARKGSSLAQILRILASVDPAWNANRTLSGLSSGEGLIWAVRDEIRERSPIREKGRVTGYEEVISDAGEPDKRLFLIESEFARVLRVTERETNTLSPIIRQAWDTGNLHVLTKTQAAHATGAHISLVAHITKDELRRLLTDTAVGNGFANRFLWVAQDVPKYSPRVARYTQWISGLSLRTCKQPLSLRME